MLAAIAVLMVAPLLAQQPPSLPVYPGDDFAFRVVSFEKHWNVFIRKLFGCPYPSGEINAGTCHPARAETDLEEFRKAREAAKKLFDLQDAVKGSVGLPAEPQIGFPKPGCYPCPKVKEGDVGGNLYSVSASQ